MTSADVSDLSQVSVVGASGYGDVNLQFINSNGKWGDDYYWFDDDNGSDGAGWYDAAGSEKAESREMQVGEAFYLTSGEVDVQLQCAGQVPAKTVETTATMAQGDAMIGNPTPSNVDLTDVVVNGASGYGDANLQFVGSNGKWGDDYYWFDDDNGLDGAGWYDIGGTEKLEPEVVVLAPGEAFYAVSSEADVDFVFPVPGAAK